MENTIQEIYGDCYGKMPKDSNIKIIDSDTFWLIYDKKDAEYPKDIEILWNDYPAIAETFADELEEDTDIMDEPFYYAEYYISISGEEFSWGTHKNYYPSDIEHNWSRKSYRVHQLFLDPFEKTIGDIDRYLEFYRTAWNGDFGYLQTRTGEELHEGLVSKMVTKILQDIDYKAEDEDADKDLNKLCRSINDYPEDGDEPFIDILGEGKGKQFYDLAMVRYDIEVAKPCIKQTHRAKFFEE